jgi:hexosaminidase
MAPGSHTYFDHYQSRDRANEPLAIGGFTPIDSAYAFEPIPAVLTPEQAKHILGYQAQVWTEYILDPKHVEYMAYPRLTALSEGLWSPKARKDFGNFMARLPVHLQRLDAMDVNYRKLDRPKTPVP